jgi:cell division inhibitor SepF
MATGCRVAMETPFGQWSPEVVVMTPARFEDAMAAVQAVQRLRTVVLHLGAMEPEEAQRTIDFVSGGVYAMDGQSERLGDTVFLFAPALVTIHRDAAESEPQPGIDAF